MLSMLDFTEISFHTFTFLHTFTLRNSIWALASSSLYLFQLQEVKWRLISEAMVPDAEAGPGTSRPIL